MICGDDEVSGHADLHPTAKRKSIDRSDRRLADVVSDESRKSPLLALFALGDDALASSDCLQIRTSTEGLVSCSGKHNRAHIDVELSLFQGISNTKAHVLVDGIACCLTIDGDDHDMTATLDENIRVELTHD